LASACVMKSPSPPGSQYKLVSQASSFPCLCPDRQVYSWPSPLTLSRYRFLYGSSAHVPVAPVGSLGVVVDQPGVEVSMHGLDRLVELLPEGLAEELVLTEYSG